MIRRELAKDPKLATESWDRFLPQFRKRHLKTSEKTAKKNEKIEAKVEARKAAGVDDADKSDKPAKKVYTPFPPAQLPRKIDLQLESGEYFLKNHEKEARETERRKQKVQRISSRLHAFWVLAHSANPISKQRQQQKDEPNEPKSSLHQTKKQLQPSTKNENESEQRVHRRNRVWIMKGRRRRKRKRRQSRKQRYHYSVMVRYHLGLSYEFIFHLSYCTPT